MVNRKGIILAGGSGSRLFPSTKSISKQLVPIYDKPMIYYPLSTMMKAGIDEILIISTPDHISLFQNLLGDGSQFGINLFYEVQAHPGGLAQAFIIGESFIDSNPCCLILGDNIFLGAGLNELLISANNDTKNATIFSYRVSNPTRFGVIEFDKNDNILGIEEKPKKPRSNYVVTGIYFYDCNVSKLAKELSPSSRGELEITDLNLKYIERGNIRLKKMSSGFTWLDTGTPESMMEASNFIYTLEKRQGKKISCPEEIALQKGFISKEEFENNLRNASGDYAEYLKTLL
tara:strand:- start:1500 stop:2366 length:867 start_codon:yes stop_codon:yes gene_type:complete